MKEGDYVRVLDTYGAHPTRWGGIMGRVLSLHTSGYKGNAESCTIKTNLNRKVSLPITHCEVISYDEYAKKVVPDQGQWSPSDNWTSTSIRRG